MTRSDLKHYSIIPQTRSGLNKQFWKIFRKNLGDHNFLPDVANFQTFIKTRVPRGLSFKTIKSLLAACRHMFKVEKLLRIRETAPPGVQNSFLNIFITTSGIN